MEKYIYILCEIQKNSQYFCLIALKLSSEIEKYNENPFFDVIIVVVVVFIVFVSNVVDVVVCFQKEVVAALHEFSKKNFMTR